MAEEGLKAVLDNRINGIAPPMKKKVLIEHFESNYHGKVNVVSEL